MVVRQPQAEAEGRGADRIAVLSRWPVIEEQSVTFRNIGGGIVARVSHPDRPLRVLGVDGSSNPLVLRTAFLDDIANLCRHAHVQGRRIDAICGDFNAVRRSVGFDQFADIAGGGYRLASDFSSEWRGTYRAGIPLYDIDHVWVHDSFEGLTCNLFTNFASNHRGQVVEFVIPAASSDQ
jgi:hypothetical protein